MSKKESKKDNLNQAMYEMFGVGKAPEAEAPKAAPAEAPKAAPAAKPVEAPKAAPVAENIPVTYLAPGTVLDTVILSSGTTVNGNVAAGDLLCSGSIKGDVVVKNNFALDTNAVVEGNITTATMTMAQGAVIGGTVTMKGNKG